MSTALVILPRVWATAEAPSSSRFQPGRRPPHSLRLLPPQVAPSQAAPSPQRQPVPQPQLAFYRKHTEALLYRYMKLSFEAARVPSPMSVELLQGEVSHRKVTDFDDSVHFVHDVDACLKRLSPGAQLLLRRIAVQGYNAVETSAMLGVSLMTVFRRYNRALDRLTAILIERRLFPPSLLGTRPGKEAGKKSTA